MTSSPTQPSIGFIGFGDQGGPIARAIAEAGYPLHVWARRESSFGGLAGVPFTPHGTPADLGAIVDIVGLCLSEDKDNREVLVQGGLLDALAAGAIVVNHGTGLPGEAEAIAALAGARGVGAIDAPVSGGHAGAVAKQLTTIVGGQPETVDRCQPLFETFSKLVVHMGGPGTGQMGKLINNAMLMANQNNVVDLLRIAERLGVNLPALVTVLRSGTASSTALQSLGHAVRPDNAQHLSRLQLIDMDIFAEAVAGTTDVHSVIERAVKGAEALPDLADLVTQ
jgi:3-hydroxyisobutyrate dehydrogenase-like beta-hydroxyacid dehydrogenase